MTLTLGQVVPLDKTGVDSPTDRRVGQTCCHRFWGSEDNPWAHLHHAPALTPFDDLGVLQTRRWPPPRFGMSTPAALALRVIPFTVDVQQGMPVCGQLIAGEQGNEVIRDMGDSGQQQ